MEDTIKNFLNKIKKIPDFEKVKFIYIFGSTVDKKNTKFSDIDFAVYHSGTKKERFKFRMKILGSMSDEYDIQIFQDLPLYVQMQVLKGKIIYAKDEQFVYEVAYDTIKRFEDFKRHYYDYVERRPTIK